MMKTSLRGDPSFGGFFVKGLYLGYEGFPNYIARLVVNRAQMTGSNSQGFLILTAMYTHHEDKHGSRTYPIEKAKTLFLNV